MLYTTDFYIDEFAFWGGARNRMDSATDEQKDRVDARLNDYFEENDKPPLDTEINDFVWFDCDDIFFPDEDE